MGRRGYLDDAFTAVVWRHEGPAAWHFVTLPEDLADALRALHGDAQGAFGQLAVAATIGATSWRTSLFYDTKRGSFLLPVKADVRRREGLADGDRVEVALEVRA